MIFRRHFVWKFERYLRSSFVTRQQSEPQSSVERTQLWYSLSFVLLEYIVDLQTCLENKLKNYFHCFNYSTDILLKNENSESPLACVRS